MRLSHSGDSGELEPPGELLEGAVTHKGVVVQLHPLQAAWKQRLTSQLGEGVILQLQPLQRLQTKECIVPETSALVNEAFSKQKCFIVEAMSQMFPFFSFPVMNEAAVKTVRKRICHST